MLDFHEKRRVRGWLYSKPAIIALVILGIFLSMSVYERFLSERETAEKRRSATAELDTLRSEAAILQAEVERLKSDRGIEGELRDRFEVARSGEQVFVILGDETDKNSSSSNRMPITDKKGTFLESVKDFFWQ